MVTESTVSSSLSQEYMNEFDDWKMKRFIRVCDFACVVAGKNLNEGTITLGTDPKNDHVITDSPSCPDFLGSIQVNGKSVKVELTTGHVHEAQEASSGLNMVINEDLTFMVSPHYDDEESKGRMICLKDMKSIKKKKIESAHQDKKIGTFPPSSEWILNGTLEDSVFKFEYKGQLFTLKADLLPDGLKFCCSFKDSTNGKETYAGGRFAIGTIHEDQKDKPVKEAVLDFNKAVHLPCAISTSVTCPLVPAENKLDFAVSAGELLDFHNI